MPTFYANSYFNPYIKHYQTLEYVDGENTYTIEVPLSEMKITKEDELYKITIEKVTDDEEINMVRTFNKLRGANG